VRCNALVGRTFVERWFGETGSEVYDVVFDEEHRRFEVQSGDGDGRRIVFSGASFVEALRFCMGSSAGDEDSSPIATLRPEPADAIDVLAEDDEALVVDR
jgi:hypothetical protein